MLTTKNSVSIHYHTVDLLHSFHPPPTLSPLVTTTLFSVSMSLFLFYFVCFGVLFRFHIWVKSYAFVFLHLTYFTKHNTLKIHPCCCKWQDFILFYGWVIFHFIYIYIYIYIATSPLAIYPSFDTYIVSLSWLLLIMLQWA